MVRRSDSSISSFSQARRVLRLGRLFRVLEWIFEILFMACLGAVGVGLLLMVPALTSFGRFLINGAVAFPFMRRGWIGGLVAYSLGLLFVSSYPPHGSLVLSYIVSGGCAMIWMGLSRSFRLSARRRWITAVLAVWGGQIGVLLGNSHHIRAILHQQGRHDILIIQHWAPFWGTVVAGHVMLTGIMLSGLAAGLWGGLLFLLMSHLSWHYGIAMPYNARFGYWRSPRGLSLLYGASLGALLMPHLFSSWLWIPVVWGTAFYLVYGANVAWALLHRLPFNFRGLTLMLLLMAGLGTIAFIVGIGMTDEWWDFRRQAERLAGRT